MAERIETGLPIPPPGNKGTALTATLRLLKAGDSFAVPKARRASLTVAIRRERFRNGGDFTTRLTNDGRVRVWRTREAKEADA